MFRRILIAAGLLLLVVIGAFAAVIAFNAPTAPPVLAAGNSIPGIAQWNFAELPKPQTLKARDGAPINYRLYPGRPDRAVVLVHGSSGTDVSMLKLAQALQAAGASVYAISLRGHGGSGTANGDVSYLGQLDDDLADLVKGLGLDKPGMHRTLIGFSSGGGFVLRIAGGQQAGLFDDYLAISPYIGQDSPTNKPNSGGWAGVAVPRIIALSLLDGIGLPWFQGLPAVHFATDAKAEQQPHAGLLLPAGGEPAARPRLARRSGAHIGAHRDRGRRQRRAVQRRSVQADAAADQSAHRRDGRAERDPSRHDRRSSGDGRHRRRLAKVGRRLTDG